MKEEWTKDQVFLTKDEVKKLLPKRKRESNKGDYGRTVIVGGSKRYGGAAYLSALAALRSGVGYTTLCVPEGLQAGYFLRLPEALLETVSGEDELRFHQAEFKKLCVYDSIAYGMGLGMSEDVAMGVEYLLEKYQGKLILDADGINSLQLLEKERLDELFKNKKHRSPTFFIVQYMLTNFLVRPDFVAFEKNGYKNPSFRICRALGALSFAWTTTSEEEENAALAHGFDGLIFERK